MPRLARVLAGPLANGITEKMVRSMVRQGMAQRWETADKSTVVTMLRSEPGGDVCDVWLAEGTMAPLLELHEQICLWAKDQGCRKMRITGRDGWLRVVPGYRKIATVMERDLWAE
jgi:hypothetical protein